MNGSRRLAGLAVLAALCLMVGSVASGKAQAPRDRTLARSPSTPWRSTTRTPQRRSTKDPTQQIKQLDDFVSKYPNSALLIYVYPLYYNAHSQLKNYPKVIEYADKLLALGDKIEPPVKYQAYYARAFAYSNLNPPPTDPDMAKKARQAAIDGLATLNALKKPDNMSQEDFDKQKKAAGDFVQLYGGQRFHDSKGLFCGHRVLQGGSGFNAR